MSNEHTEPRLDQQDAFGIGVVFGAFTMKKIMLGDMLSVMTPILAPLQFESTKKFATITEKGFEININNMEKGKRYFMNYADSIYQIMRNDNDELELFEIG